MIPSPEQCFKLMEEYHMLENIKSHSLMVERVARVLAEGLRDAGVDISLEKTTAGALMHDIGKTLCLNTNDNHATKGAEICLENDLDEIVDIVREHVRLKAFHPGRAICEKEIIYYADKRVNHDAIVSLEKRLNELIKRYSKGDENLTRAMTENFRLCEEVEKKIFGPLSFDPNDIAEKVRSAHKR